MITLDFETYYDAKYSLKKIAIDLYVGDERFLVHGAAVKVDDKPSEWVTGSDFATFAKTLTWDSVLCHNAYFDIYILTQHYGIRPDFIFDTMSMSRAHFTPFVSASLAELSKRLGTGMKAEGLDLLKGRRHVTPDVWRTLVPYALNDAELTYKNFLAMRPFFSDTELKTIDLIVRMFTEPTLMVDHALLRDYLSKLRQGQNEILEGVADYVLPEVQQLDMFSNTELAKNKLDEVRTLLRSDLAFGSLLEKYGQRVPTKISPRTKKQAPALSKKDAAFVKLKDSKKKPIAALVSARLAIESTQEETRTLNFLESEILPIQLMYYGASTGRTSGGSDEETESGGRNPQNLGRKSPLRKSIVAPPGYVIYACDSAQIEARGVAVVAGQKDLVQDFALDRDPYSVFATELYGYPVSKKNPQTKIERYVGKTCILGLGYGMGGDKFQNTLEVGDPPLLWDKEKCVATVKFYRTRYPMIPRLWYKMEDILLDILDGVKKDYGVFSVDARGIRLPNGLYIQYPQLERYKTEKFGKPATAFRYFGKRQGRTDWIDIYGGKVTENLIQALSRIVVTEQAVEIAKRYRVVGFVHDEVICVIKESEIEEANAFITDVMSQPPKWCPEWPIACEASWGRTYADCK